MTDSLSIDVPIPSSAPSGEALFGWTWFNTAGESQRSMCGLETTLGRSTVSDRFLLFLPFLSLHPPLTTTHGP